MGSMHPPRLPRRSVLAGLASSSLLMSAPAVRAAPHAHLRAAEWAAFKARFMTEDGRIVDDAKDGRSHSEGQGFGMLLATGYDDPATFLRLWRWTRERLQTRDDALLAWHWDAASGEIADRNNASDGDLFVAWALLRGYALWGEPAWRAAALDILQDLRSTCVIARGGGHVLLPGAEGFTHGDRVIINLSYWVFPALVTFAASGVDGPWSSLTYSGLALVDSFARTGTGLVPDWCVLAETIEPAPDLSFAFGFDAIRVPLYLRWGFPASEVRARLRPFRDYAAHHASIAAVPARLDLATGEAAEHPLSLGGQAILLMAQQTVDGGDLLLPLLRKELDYYSSALLLLTKLAATEIQR